MSRAKTLAIEALELVDASINIAGEIDDYPTLDNKIVAALAALRKDEPIDMVLFCPRCCAQHIDAPEFPNITTALDAAGQPPIRDAWTNPPHRSHLCSSCGHIWRPADVPTNGVLFVQTKGKDDKPLANPIDYVKAAATEGYGWGVDSARPRAPDGWPSTQAGEAPDAEWMEPILGNALANSRP